ncbi:hypothetical protein AB4Z17_11600 [Paenibacillus sp. TAF43_2]|uniref:hypothetical protein n=1 Tax=Paenibacillus sp. TAF43_2 TaxID=3233069 RepID=UPI003F96C125
MIKLTELQMTIMNVIAKHDGIKYGDIMEKSGVTLNNGTGTIQALLNKQLVVREGKPRKYLYRSTGILYEARPDSDEENNERIKRADPFLTKSALYRFTDDQLIFLKNNSNLSRSKLAQKLGISKLELNFALDLKRK